MSGSSVFRTLVKGYQNLSKKEKEETHTKIKGPLEVFGSVKIQQEKTEKLKKEKLEGIEIPDFKTKRVSSLGIKHEEEKQYFQATYALIPAKPKRNEKVLSYAKIFWDPQKGCYKYNIVQPELSPRLKKLFIRLKELIEEKLDIDLTRLKKGEAKEYLRKQIFELLDYFGIKLTENEKEILDYYINRDFLGLGVIEPLMHDSQIEEISCDGVNIPIYIFHRDSRLGSIQTNISFNNSEELDDYLVRLAQICGQSISVTDPLLSGTLPDGSRVQGTLSTDIARRGSNFTIRKFSAEPFTPAHLLNFNTVDVKTLAFLWMAIDYGCSALIAGGSATGKTTFLNVLSLFIKPDMKIVSIEDTSELRLPHPHWVPQLARVSISTEEGKRKGEVDLFDLLKESIRQRPDYIIVGEVRGKEAYVLFQQIATGHPSLATIHADTIEKLGSRLISPPISLPTSLLESLDLIVFLTKQRYRGQYVRRVQDVFEIIGFNLKEKVPITNKIFEWDATKDKIKISNKSIILQKIIKKTGLKEKEILEEMKRRMLVLYWIQQRNMTNYKDVSRVLNLYYNYPEKVLDIISGEI